MGEEEVVSRLQDELCKLGALMTSACEATQQLHAPEAVPAPPPGVHPEEFFHNWARKRQEETPFATRGFQEEGSADVQANASRMRAKAEEMKGIVNVIEELMDQANEFDKAEDEQMQELASLEKENEQAGKDLEEAVKRGNEFLSRLASLQRRVAAGALGF